MAFLIVCEPHENTAKQIQKQEKNKEKEKYQKPKKDIQSYKYEKY